MRKILLFLVGSCLTSLVAGLATAPFILHDFQQLSAYTLMANILVSPIVTFWIMPAVIAAFVLLPLGWEYPALWLLEKGIAVMLACAKWVSDLPFAIFHTPPLHPAGLALVTFGGLWLCFWQTRWRYAGAVAMVVGILTVLLYQSPDILVGEEGKLIAVRVPEKGFALISGSGRSRNARTWLEMLGEEKFIQPKEVPSEILHCDKQGCVYYASGKAITIPRSRAAFMEDCSYSDYIIAAFGISKNLCTETSKIDFFDLRDKGAHALFVNHKQIKVENVSKTVGCRPWTRSFCEETNQSRK